MTAAGFCQRTGNSLCRGQTVRQPISAGAAARTGDNARQAGQRFKQVRQFKRQPAVQIDAMPEIDAQLDGLLSGQRRQCISLIQRYIAANGLQREAFFKTILPIKQPDRR